MKKIIYSLCLLFVAFGFTACEDNDQEIKSLNGTWNYTEPHFKFEYAEDSITIDMMVKKMQIDVDMVKNMFLAMAREKMGDYFQGLEFKSTSQMIVKAKMKDGTPLEIDATYTQKKDQLTVQLDAEDMKNLAGEMAAMIPALSFKYTEKGNTLVMYFDKAYIRTVYAAMENMIVPAIIKMMNLDFTQIPVPEKVAETIKRQIADIFDKTVLLEIGFQLEYVQ